MDIKLIDMVGSMTISIDEFNAMKAQIAALQQDNRAQHASRQYVRTLMDKIDKQQAEIDTLRVQLERVTTERDAARESLDRAERAEGESKLAQLRGQNQE